MARAHGTGSVYKDARTGKWVAQRVISVHPRRFRRESFDTKTAAKNELQAWADAHAALSDNDGPLLDDFLDLWQASRHFTPLAAATRVQYTYLLKTYVRPTLGRTRLRALTPKLLSAWLDTLIPEGRKARRTVGLVRDVLRSALTRAVEDGWLDRNPLSSLTLQHVPGRRIAVLSPADVGALLDASLPWLRSLLALMTLTGLRRGEALGLQWDDVDWAGSLTVQRSVVATVDRGEGKVGAGVKEPKTEAGVRTIPLPALAIEFLAAHRRRLELEHAARGRPMPTWVFPSTTGGFIAPRNLSRAFYLARNAAGLSTRARLHDLRHTAATALLTLGVDENAVAAWIGHRDPRTTRSIYHHPDRSVQEDGAAALSRHWRASMTPRESPNDSQKSAEESVGAARTEAYSRRSR